MKPSALFTMDDFRGEMRRRDVYNKKTRVLFRDERERRRNRIATGAPRRVDRRTDASQRLESRKAFAAAVIHSAKARLGLLRNERRERAMDCPWQAVDCCGPSCRCRGTGKVTVGFMIAHYERVVAEMRTWR